MWITSCYQEMVHRSFWKQKPNCNLLSVGANGTLATLRLPAPTLCSTTTSQSLWTRRSTQTNGLKKWQLIQADQPRPELNPSEVSSLRGVLGTISWRSTQTAPEFLAESSLLLSEIGKATIGTLHKVNKLVREMRRRAGQTLFFKHGIPRT